MFHNTRHILQQCFPNHIFTNILSKVNIWAARMYRLTYSYSDMITFLCFWDVKSDDGCLVQPKRVKFLDCK